MSKIRLILAFAREINFRNARRIVSIALNEGGGPELLYAIRSAVITVLQVNKQKQWQPKTVLETSRINAPLVPGEVAFVLYCFFPEYVERILRLIRKFSDLHPSVDFFVVSPDQEIVSALKEAQPELQALKLVSLSQNRGRNFGPIFVELATTMQKYKYVVHLHSKRSSHSRRRMGSIWANSLWGALGENNEVFERFIQEFRTNPKIAVAYSLVENFFPPKAFGWGNNDAGVRQIFVSAIPTLRSTSEIARFPFPAGGMFMIRTDAYRELLGIDWSYQMFPEERGQLDGTSQHVVERLIGFLPYKQGLEQLVFLEKSRVFTTDTSYIFDLF